MTEPSLEASRTTGSSACRVATIRSQSADLLPEVGETEREAGSG